MTIEGYYDSVIKQWYSAEKITPSLKKEMRDIINKFYAIRDFYKEIPANRVDDLTYEFKKIEDFLNQ